MTDDLKKRLSTFLRMMESGHEGESEEAARQFFKLLQKHDLLRDLADHPEWVMGGGDDQKLREAVEANLALYEQNTAVIAENKRLRAEVAIWQKLPKVWPDLEDRPEWAKGREWVRRYFEEQDRKEREKGG